MNRKKIWSFLIPGFLCCLFVRIVCASDAMDVVGEPVQPMVDPAAALVSADPSVSTGTEDVRYTEEEYRNLPESVRQDIYLNSPQFLPKGFSPDKYMNPQPGNQEGN